jgi:iron(III) transport system substrate-binding protein
LGFATGTTLTLPRRSFLLATLVMLLGGLLTACGSSGGGANSITLYNGQHPETTDALVSAFEKATGINVEVESNDEDFQANEIVQEGSHSPADVFFTENSQPLEHLQEKGLLAPVNASTLAHTPSRFNSPLGDWVGVTARVSVIVYNPSLIEKSQLPTHVLQLADPAYKGKLAIAPGETDFQPIVTSVDRAYGEARTLKWLRGIKANSNRPQGYDSNEDLTSAVNDGEAAFGIINQYYWYRLRAQVGVSNMHSEIAYFAAGDPGYVIDVSGAAVLKSSRHQADAEKFLAFITSKAGQEIIAHSTSYEYPIASGVTTAQPETPFDLLHPYPITIAELGDGLQAVAFLQEVELL